MATTTVIKLKNMRPIPQDSSATCWLAAYQMMFDWKGKSKAEIPNLLKGAVTSVETCYEKGLDKTDWDKAAKAFGLTSIKGAKTFSAAELAGYLSHGPVLLHGKFPLGMHSIVITGVTVADYPWEMDMTTYLNPYWTGDKTVNYRTSSFNDFIKVGVEKNEGLTGVLQHW